MKSKEQIGLFTGASYAPEWLKGAKADFDPALAERYKREAMASASSSIAHQELLDLLRSALITIARSRPDRTATADDAQACLLGHGHSPSALGNAAGSLFRSAEWVLVGYRPSERVSRHGNRIGIWQLKDRK